MPFDSYSYIFTLIFYYSSHIPIIIPQAVAGIMAFTPESVNKLKRICLEAIGNDPHKFDGFTLINNKGFSEKATGCAAFDRLLSGAPSSGDGMNGQKASVPLTLAMISHSTKVEEWTRQGEVPVRSMPKLGGLQGEGDDKGDLDPSVVSGGDKKRSKAREEEEEEDSHLEVFRALYIPQSGEGDSQGLSKMKSEETIRPIPVTVKLDRERKLLVEMTVTTPDPSVDPTLEAGSAADIARVQIELI